MATAGWPLGTAMSTADADVARAGAAELPSPSVPPPQVEELVRGPVDLSSCPASPPVLPVMQEHQEPPPDQPMGPPNEPPLPNGNIHEYSIPEGCNTHDVFLGAGYKIPSQGNIRLARELQAAISMRRDAQKCAKRLVARTVVTVMLAPRGGFGGKFRKLVDGRWAEVNDRRKLTELIDTRIRKNKGTEPVVKESKLDADYVPTHAKISPSDVLPDDVIITKGSQPKQKGNQRLSELIGSRFEEYATLSPLTDEVKKDGILQEIYSSLASTGRFLTHDDANKMYVCVPKKGVIEGIRKRLCRKRSRPKPRKKDAEATEKSPAGKDGPSERKHLGGDLRRENGGTSSERKRKGKEKDVSDEKEKRIERLRRELKSEKATTAALKKKVRDLEYEAERFEAEISDLEERKDRGREAIAAIARSVASYTNDYDAAA